MSAEGVKQLTALADLFKVALNSCRPRSVAILGIAGGNGLEQVDSTITQRTVGVDINHAYLDQVRRRFGLLGGLELYCCDLSEREFRLTPVELVHAALFFEHAELGLAFENALSLVAAGGRLSVVLQLPSSEAQGIAPTRYTSMQRLKQCFTLIDIADFQSLLAQNGFRLVTQERRSLPAGKGLWLGIFARNPDAPAVTANSGQHR